MQQNVINQYTSLCKQGNLNEILYYNGKVDEVLVKY